MKKGSNGSCNKKQRLFFYVLLLNYFVSEVRSTYVL